MSPQSLARRAIIAILVFHQAATARPLTLWIMPTENAGPGEIAAGEEIARRVEAFNREYANTRVTVENTTDPVLKMQMLSWNPSFAVPNAAVVMSQKATLKALQGFADRIKTDIRVRIITWDEAFDLISGLNPAVRAPGYPDVIQIGSTWGAWLASKGVIMSRPDAKEDRANWVGLPGLPASKLPFITDVRLLFYWKRLPSALPGSREFVLNTSSWEALIESVRTRAGTSDTIAFPTGLTLNVLHDYAPLVWSGNGPFFYYSWRGWRFDLTSAQALTVPLLLQKSAIETVRPGEPRTLIAFPESSHEEVDRLFVNGGYRVTQEPANFIDRWRQDFEKRHQTDGRQFWDYAGAAVPPKVFKGGSSLVVTSGTEDPAAAFALADFLAGDTAFTKILAESGFLPSGRRNHGSEILVASLFRSGSLEEVQKFVDTVERAIQQGTEYPDFVEWPTLVESPQMKEALQLVWRRMGERDPEKLRKAAQQAEWLLNSQISWPDRIYRGLIEARWVLMALLATFIAVTALIAYRRFRTQRNLMLLLFLYRAFRHGSAKFLGDNFYTLATEARSGKLGCAGLIDSAMELSIHFKDRLAVHIDRISEGQFTDMLGTTPPMRLDEVADLAFSGALHIFEAKNARQPPYIHHSFAGLEQWRIERMPHTLAVALEEWFLNFIKQIEPDKITRPALTASLASGILQVECSGSLDNEHLERLHSEPNAKDISTSRQGLKLIRNILYYAYGVRVRAENVVSGKGQPRIRLTVPLGSYLKPA